MSRLLVSALALLLAVGKAAAQEAPPAAPPAKEPAPAAKPATAEKPATPSLSDLDPKTRAAIQAEIDKMREDIRNEVRAEIQGAQSAAEFLGATAEGPKLEFLELDGYLRFRGQLTGNADLRSGKDASGFYLYPVPLQGAYPFGRGTLATANMRLRVEPTLNVSEHIRVRAQLDFLDNYVLGSSASKLMDSPFSPYPTPFWDTTRFDYLNDPRNDRPAIAVKRAWAEVQTPVGLLSFGRMPSQWGLGILANAAPGVDDDFGDTVDRLQFAIPPVTTPIGKLSFVPILDFDAEGVLNADPRYGPGAGQPFDAESSDDARTYALKIARLDTDDEVRRKLDRHESSFNFGAYYNYRRQRWVYPQWFTEGYAQQNGYTDDPATTPKQRRAAYAHILDLWARLLSGRWRFEGEVAGIYGDVAAYDFRPTDATNPTPHLGDLLLRQWGGSLQMEFAAIPNKVSLGTELGAASGDSAPGFGNDPNRVLRDENGNWVPQPAGSIEGPQFNLTNDHDIRNFRFNPAYRVDLVLWRTILGNVTDAWYLRPNLRWDMFPGLRADFAVIYSQTFHPSSTPAAIGANAGSKPLGIEGDASLTYTSGDGFTAWMQYGILQPFAALQGPYVGSLSRGHALNVGLGAKF